MIAHIWGEQMKQMIRRHAEGDADGAAAINEELRPAYDLLKVTTNPIAIKTAMNMLGSLGSRGSRVVGAALALGVALTLAGCSDMLDVSLPAQLTGDALNDPISAGTQINSIIMLFENSMSDFKYTIHGHEDAGEVVFMSPSIGSGVVKSVRTSTNRSRFGLMPAGRLPARRSPRLVMPIW